MKQSAELLLCEFVYTLIKNDLFMPYLLIFLNLLPHDIIPENGVLAYHIRTGATRKIYVTQEACITGSESALISA